jgi:hypothetical protein
MTESDIVATAMQICVRSNDLFTDDVHCCMWLAYHSMHLIWGFAWYFCDQVEHTAKLQIIDLEGKNSTLESTLASKEGIEYQHMSCWWVEFFQL